MPKFGGINDHSSLLNHVVQIDAFPTVKLIKAVSISKNFSALVCQVLIEGFLHYPGSIPLKNLRDAIECCNHLRRQSKRNLRFFVARHEVILVIRWDAR
jgi:hypothetical protein